jgi:hypothetical protein
MAPRKDAQILESLVSAELARPKAGRIAHFYRSRAES